MTKNKSAFMVENFTHSIFSPKCILTILEENYSREQIKEVVNAAALTGFAGKEILRGRNPLTT